MTAPALYAITPPPEADLAAYHQRVTEVGFVEASFWFVKQHAERLMKGSSAQVIDLDSYRDGRQT